MGLYLGLISGTGMDAIDAALVDFDAAPLSLRRRPLRIAHCSYCGCAASAAGLHCAVTTQASNSPA
jgi:1,6-anhydro-N-acetylmuramate kinase